MKYTVFYYEYDREGNFKRQYDCFTGTRSECYKWRNRKVNFRWQYKVCKSPFN